MRKLILSTLIILIVLVCATFACLSSGGGEVVGQNTGSSSTCCQPTDLQSTQAAKATEAYGAEQFHLQLTAIAGQDQ
ncbi:MAG: hypothetical protein JXA78_17750 [Anaerolineales bacterium]|nr:hypothetical protein [Anaerolineales bacterium]